jgi:hypothetical protein
MMAGRRKTCWLYVIVFYYATHSAYSVQTGFIKYPSAAFLATGRNQQPYSITMSTRLLCRGRLKDFNVLQRREL